MKSLIAQLKRCKGWPVDIWLVGEEVPWELQSIDDIIGGSDAGHNTFICGKKRSTSCEIMITLDHVITFYFHAPDCPTSAPTPKKGKQKPTPPVRIVPKP